jgi:hypothetical protein
MASLLSQRHRCPTLATPSPSGAPPFPTSTSSEEVQKILNPATASSVQLSHASFRMHNNLHPAENGFVRTRKCKSESCKLKKKITGHLAKSTEIWEHFNHPELSAYASLFIVRGEGSYYNAVIALNYIPRH